MNHLEYKDFHEKFTRENQFEFSYGIYLARDIVRNREINIKNFKEFLSLLKATSETKSVLAYLKLNNKNSPITQKAIKYIEINL